MSKVKAAGLFLVNKDRKILVGHPTRHDPKFWSIPKGKIDGDETPLQAAIRETYEESNVKLFADLHDFVELGTMVYRHKKKDITFFAHFEREKDNWNNLTIMCNSNVPEERGGFPEMDAFKWVTLEEARDILHETQVAVLDLLEEKTDDHIAEQNGTYTMLWCNDCNDYTYHREKLSAVMSGHRVCNRCSRMNPVCELKKVGDDYFSKVSNDVLWLEYNDDGTFKSKHTEPEIGLNLLMSPFNSMFTWQTTEITQIIDVNNDKPRKYVKFKTKNSIYELYYHTL